MTLDEQSCKEDKTENTEKKIGRTIFLPTNHMQTILKDSYKKMNILWSGIEMAIFITFSAQGNYY